MRTDIIVATIAAALAVAAPLSAQDAHVRIEGTVESRIPSRSAQAARVSLVRMDQERSITSTAVPDARGHYQLDSLSAGLYLVQVSDPTLDSLYLAPPPTELRLTPGKSVHADFLLPTADELRASVCPGVKLGEGKAVVAGRAIDSDTDQPIVGAQVVAGWTDLSFDKQALKADPQKRITSVSTGPTGDYRLCGVPSGHSLWIQLQHEGRAGAITRLSVGDAEGVAVRNISMSINSAPTIAALDSVEKLAAASADTTMDGLDLTGTAIISGTVKGQSGQPLAGAQVRVRNAKSSGTTDDAGRFTLRELPSGTQVLLVRSLGYGLVEIPVELRPGRSVTQDALLTRAAVLDSVKVVAKKPEFAEFEFNQRNNHFGKFMTSGEIVRRGAKETGDLVRALGGFNVQGRGPNTKTFSKVALAANPKCGEANIVMEGVEGLSINDVYPDNIGGIEAYPDNAFIPARYLGHGDCGLIVIWLKAKKDKRPQPQVGVGYNGY